MCEPKAWLLSGEGRYFNTFLAKGHYRVSECEASSAAVWESMPPASPHGLYCWACMQSSGYEPALMALQLHRGVGIFACDGRVVFSSTDGSVAGVPTVGLGPDPSRTCVWGGTTTSFCNTRFFITAWEKIVALGHFRGYAWTVKVDPDTVFFPGKLREHLGDFGNDEAMIIQNSQSPKMLGAIEVVARAAVERFAQSRASCFDRLDEDNTGEDGYFSDCFSDVLGAEAHMDSMLLESTDYAGACGSGYVAYHPMKNEGSMGQCYTLGR